MEGTENAMMNRMATVILAGLIYAQSEGKVSPDECLTRSEEFIDGSKRRGYDAESLASLGDGR